MEPQDGDHISNIDNEIGGSGAVKFDCLTICYHGQKKLGAILLVPRKLHIGKNHSIDAAIMLQSLHSRTNDLSISPMCCLAKCNASKLTSLPRGYHLEHQAKCYSTELPSVPSTHFEKNVRGILVSCANNGRLTALCS